MSKNKIRNLNIGEACKFTLAAFGALASGYGAYHIQSPENQKSFEAQYSGKALQAHKEGSVAASALLGTIAVGYLGLGVTATQERKQRIKTQQQIRNANRNRLKPC